jgi:ascorbate-specific PTS system EIIC-type component UlaA
VTVVIVLFATISGYYFGALGAILGAVVVLASLSRRTAAAVLPSMLLIGLAWGAGCIVGGDIGGMIGAVIATALAIWLESFARAAPRLRWLWNEPEPAETTQDVPFSIHGAAD